MKTSKIQVQRKPTPREDHFASSPVLNGSQRRSALTPKTHRGLPSRESPLDRAECLEPPRERLVSAAVKAKNKSLVDSPYYEPMVKLRLMAESCSSILDNEIFRLNQVARDHKQALDSAHQDLTTILNRKFVYAVKYLDIQLNSSLFYLKSEKDKLDSAVEQIESQLAKRSNWVTMNQFIEMKHVVAVSEASMPKTVVFPVLPDVDELKLNLGKLIDSYLCKAEVGVLNENIARHNLHVNELLEKENLPRLGNIFDAKTSRPASDQVIKVKQLSFDGMKTQHQRKQLHIHHSILHKEDLLEKENTPFEATMFAKIVQPVSLKPAALEPQTLDQPEPLDLECHEDMEAILPRNVTIEEVTDEENYQ